MPDRDLGRNTKTVTAEGNQPVIEVLVALLAKLTWAKTLVEVNLAAAEAAEALAKVLVS